MPGTPTLQAETLKQLTGLFEYMASWNADHMRDVTQHEIQMMHSAAAEGMRILDGAHTRP
jgi:hypothetical protein